MADEVVIPALGGGEGGGVAVADPPANEEVVEEVPAGGEGGGEGGEPGAGEGEGGGEGGEKGEGDLSDIETDGRKIDAKTRIEIAELKKTNPAAAKKWAESYFRNQAVMKELPEAKSTTEAVAQIRTMKATIESLGGEKGIADLQTEVNDYRAEIKQFADGDRTLIEQLYDPANPSGLVRAAQNAFDVLKEKNLEVYKEAIRPAFLARAQEVGVNNLITNLMALVKEGKGQECWKLLTDADAWFKDERGKVESGKAATAAKNPEAEKLAKERSDFEQQKKNEFITRVDNDVNRANNPELDKHINPLQKELGLQKAGMQIFRSGLISRVWNVLANDKAYLSQVRALRAKNDSVKTAEYIHKAFVERLPEQFRLHRNEIYPNASKKAVPAAGGAAPKNGEPQKKIINIQQGQRPRREQVDWNKTSDTMWISGRAYLLDGKLVTGFKDAPANSYK
jgi:hypothetical protein